MGHSCIRRFTQVMTLLILLSKEGGSQPLFFLRRLAYFGLRYLVFRFLRLLRAARRLASAFVICSPRCTRSAAKTTSPVASLTSASPVVLLPGSILTRNGCLMLYRRGWGWPRTPTYLNSLLT